MSDPLMHTDTAIVCPTVVDNQPLLIDLTVVYQIEQRVQEVAFVTPAKAPELMARFNEAYLYLHKYVSLLEYELVRAKQAAEKIGSIVLLDKAPAILQAKGLTNGKSKAGSEDLRNAVLAQDEEYQGAVDRQEKIRCIIELLKGKLKGFEWAYTSIKKILAERVYGLPDLNPGVDTGTAQVGQSNPDPMRSVNAFGKAKY